MRVSWSSVTWEILKLLLGGRVDVGELGTPFAGAPLGRGGRGTEGGGDGRELCEELLRIVELELGRMTSPLTISLYFIYLSTVSQIRLKKGMASTTTKDGDMRERGREIYLESSIFLANSFQLRLELMS